MLGGSLGSRTGKVNRMFMDGNGVQTKSSRDDGTGKCSLASWIVLGIACYSQAAKGEDEQKSSLV